MSTTMITGKFEAIFPFDLMLKGQVSNSIRLNWPGLGHAELLPPDNVEDRSLECGQYGSKMRMIVSLDIGKKPAELKIDQFFIHKFIDLSFTFLTESWIHTRMPEIDPYVGPKYIKVEYFNEQGTPFTNPETGKNYHEEHIPRGVILEVTDWDEITDNLVNNKIRDLGEHFLLNAKYMKYVRRYDFSIILCAIACEYKVKLCCDTLISKKRFNRGLWSTLTKSARPGPGVMEYYNKIITQLSGSSPKNSTDAQIKELPKRLQTLFKDRNRIMHTGMLFKGLNITPNQVNQKVDEHIETTELALRWLNSLIGQ